MEGKGFGTDLADESAAGKGHEEVEEIAEAADADTSLPLSDPFLLREYFADCVVLVHERHHVRL